MIRSNRLLLAAVALACVSAWAPQSTAMAQVPAASEPSGGAPRAYSASELETLVGPFALYPDDLVAIILPASTFPLQIVQADRFLDKRKANPKLEIDAGWDDSVKSLANYPDVVKKMSADLEWTEALGEAVVSDNGAVMEAVQVFRRKAQSAGNLKSNDKQKIVIEQQVVRIEQADPTVIYVPRYEPSEVIVVGAPVYPYYPTPYPVYHYPYPPGAALATGIIWGAALGAAWNGGHYHSNYGGGSINNSNNITIDRGNTNVGSGNRGNRPSQLPSNTWKPTKQPGQVGSVGNRPGGGNRVGDPGRGGGGMGGASASQRPSQGRDFGGGGGPSASTRPAGGDAGRGGGAFGGMDSGGAAHRASARGMESRGGFGGGQGGGGMQARGGGGGGAHAAAGGGGRGGGGMAARGGGGARAGGGGGGGRGGGGGGGRGGGGRGR